MGAEQSITLYSIGMYACLAIMVIGFGLAVLFFFKFRIPQVFALMTGRVERKSIEKMQKSGVLRSTNDLKNEHSSNSAKLAYMNMTSKTGDFATEDIKAEVLSQGTAASPEGSVPLHVGVAETTVLHTEQETTVLGNAHPAQPAPQAPQPAPAPMPHSAPQQSYSDDLGATAILGTPDQMNDALGATTILDGNSPAAHAYRFDVIEHTVVIHTDEVI